MGGWRLVRYSRFMTTLQQVVAVSHSAIPAAAHLAEVSTQRVTSVN
jgi:hypothetical protein